MGRGLTLVLVAAALALLFIFIWNPGRRHVAEPPPAFTDTSSAAEAAGEDAGVALTATLADAHPAPAEAAAAEAAPADPAPADEAPPTAEPPPPPSEAAPTPAAAPESEHTAAPPDDAPPPAQRFTPDRYGIKAAVEAAQPELKECYEAWLAADPTLGGKVVLQFTLRAAAEPERPAEIVDVGMADSSVGHPMMEGCVLNAIQGLEFESPHGDDVKVRYPLFFASLDAGILD